MPSKWFAIVSKKVFCGARRPFITGISFQDRRRVAGRKEENHAASSRVRLQLFYAALTEHKLSILSFVELEAT